MNDEPGGVSWHEASDKSRSRNKHGCYNADHALRTSYQLYGILSKL